MNISSSVATQRGARDTWSILLGRSGSVSVVSCNTVHPITALQTASHAGGLACIGYVRIWQIHFVTYFCRTSTNLHPLAKSANNLHINPLVVTSALSKRFTATLSFRRCTFPSLRLHSVCTVFPHVGFCNTHLSNSSTRQSTLDVRHRLFRTSPPFQRQSLRCGSSVYC